MPSLRQMEYVYSLDMSLWSFLFKTEFCKKKRLPLRQRPGSSSAINQVLYIHDRLMRNMYGVSTQKNDPLRIQEL